MNRTDRLLGIVLELQSKGHRRAEDLAATFETSKRTIYRDIQALSEVGIPVVATTGHGYGLMEGFFLPPVRFTRDESLLLLLGVDWVGRQVDPQYRRVAHEAIRKISAVLPDHLKAEVAYLQENIRFITPERDHAEVLTYLQRLRTALMGHNRVTFNYHARDHQPTQREVDPYSLVYSAHVWYLVAYCHLRADLRHFRLDRMEAVEVLQQTFARPAKLNSLPPRPEPKVEVQVRFLPQVMRRIKELSNFFITAQEEDAEGLLVTFHIHREQDIVPWLLGWGTAVKVIKPVSLQQRLITEANKIVAQYNPDGRGFRTKEGIIVSKR